MYVIECIIKSVFNTKPKLILQVSGTCQSLSLSSDLKSLSVITKVRSADNRAEICYIQVRSMNVAPLHFHTCAYPTNCSTYPGFL